MDARQSKAAPERAVSSPSRRLIAAGVKRGAGPLITTDLMSPADRAAHEAASYVRRYAGIGGITRRGKAA